MKKLWKTLICPILNHINANYIIEIGSDDGLNTINILEYCKFHNAHMTAVDPHPKFDINKYKKKYGDKFEIYTELSLSRIPLLNDYDAILLDGDHNWYTVYNELKIIEKQFKNKKFPIVFMHDVGWPYARRDLYYNPDNIPEAFRQPYKKLGMYPDHTELKSGGLNSDLYNSIYENNPNNGVLTAVEDFIDESNLELYFELIDVFHGLGILFTHNDEIENFVKKTIKNADLVSRLEKARVNRAIIISQLKKQNDSLKTELNDNKTKFKNVEDQFNQIENKFEQMEYKLSSSDKIIEEKEKLLKEAENHLKLSYELIQTNGTLIEKLGKKEEEFVKELNSHISRHEADFLEIEYLKNSGRPIFQRLISKFPSLYILFNMNETGIKNALVNINGYRTIKKNNLFNIGFYLKNYSEVRLSGMDPILHYMYHGFKEGKKPNTTFDANYYLKTYKDIKNSNLNPFVHYSLYGKKEGRKTHEIISVNNNSTETILEKSSIIAKPQKKVNKKLLNDLESNFKVSIIMPTYNRKYIIKRAIDSVLNQTFKNYELIICDDGSTDNTEELLKKDYEDYFKSGKFIYLEQVHAGVSKARNTCLERSNGDLIAYLDTDNYWEYEYLEEMVSLFQDNPKCDSAYSVLQVHNFVENKHYVLYNLYDRNKILKGNQIDLNVFIHRRKLYELLGGFNESLTRLVDWDLILRYTRGNDPLFLNKILVQYYVKENFDNISLKGSYGEHRAKIYDIHSDEIINRGVSKNNFITDPFITLQYLKSKKPIYNFNYLKIAVFIEGELKSLKSCPYLRLYSPLKQLCLNEHFKIFVYGRDDFANVDVNNILNCKLFDAIIIQRSAIDLEDSKIILKKCKDNNIKVIYESDDDLLSIDKSNRDYNFLKKRIIAMDYLIKNSNLITVSTNVLFNRFNNITKTTIVRNYLVNELKPITNVKTIKSNNSIDIGYYGTLTHDDDLLMIKDSISKIVKKFKENYNFDVKFHIIGGMNKKHEESWYSKVEIPKDSTDFVSFMNWIKNNVKYDIMLAPLMDTQFNNAKSELKYIEYSALGMPGIYSDLPPYNSVIKDGVNGLLAKTNEDWEEKIEKLILDQDLRIKIVENAQKDINENYLLENRVEDWQNILHNITEIKKSRNFKISIILPIHNMEKYLRKTLESIEMQTIGLENLEVIMINEASSDGSKLIIDEYAHKYENFIAFHLPKSSGTPGKPRNIGIEMASGDYIMFIDHDDFYSDDACEILYNKISKEGVDIVSGIYNFVHDTDIKPLHDKRIFENKSEFKVKNIAEKEELLTLPPVVWSKIFKRSFIMDNNLRFPVGVLAEDLIFLSTALLKANGIIFLDHAIYNYRVLVKDGESSLSQRRDINWFKGVCDARKTIWDTYQKEGKENHFKYICKYSLNYLLEVFTKTNMKFNDKYEVLEYIHWIFEKSNDYGIDPPKKYANLYNSIIEKDYKNAIIISENLS